MAASQTIAATQQMQHGRKTASLKTSYEALSSAVQEVDFGKKQLVVAARADVAAVQDATKKKKKQNRKSAVGASMLQYMDTLAEVTPEWQKELVPMPDEPTYCTCKQVSYGNMVACDNKTCEIEWFHYSCVGILAPPKGKWYCPQCSITRTNSSSHKAG